MPAHKRKPVGPRPGRPDTRGDVLRAARQHFAGGYGSATLREIARTAHVDPSLVVQFFGGKEGLFKAAIADVINPSEALPAVLAGGPDGLGERLATYFLSLWENPETRRPIQAMFLSAAQHPPAAAMLREFVSTEVIGRVAKAAGGRNVRLRASLAGSQLVGAAFARYIVGIPELADLPLPYFARIVGRTLDGYLTEPLPPRR